MNAAIRSACILVLFTLIMFPANGARTTVQLPSFSIDDAIVTESAGSVTVTIRKHGQKSRNMSVVRVYTQNGIAAAGSDYTTLDTQLSFSAKQNSRTVSITILNDTVVESQVEGFTVKLQAITNARLYDGTAAVNIQDDDNPPPVDEIPPPPPGDETNAFDPIASNFTVADYLEAAAVPGHEEGGEGAFRFICSASHLGYNDPIVYPGQVFKSHLHQFFGNTLTDHNSTYGSLRSTGESTCNGNKLNRSAYWVPAMLNGKGSVVIPDYITIYYKAPPLTGARCREGSSTKQGICVTLPRGLRYVFDRRTPEGEVTGWFNCDGNGATGGQYPDIIAAGPFCPVGSRMGMVMFAPSCWDGKNLDSANHRSHMAYAGYGSHGYLRCPLTHPYVIPQLTIGVWYLVDADLNRTGTWNGESTSWHLASDIMPGMPMMRPGTSQHADWFGAWDDGVLANWWDHCINLQLNGDSGNLCNGTAMKILPGPGYVLTADPHTVPVP